MNLQCALHISLLDSLANKKQTTKFSSANFQKQCSVQAKAYWEFMD